MLSPYIFVEISAGECLKYCFSAILFKISRNALRIYDCTKNTNISIILDPQVFVYSLKIKHIQEGKLWRININFIILKALEKLFDHNFYRSAKHITFNHVCIAFKL